MNILIVLFFFGSRSSFTPHKCFVEGPKYFDGKPSRWAFWLWKTKEFSGCKKFNLICNSTKVLSYGKPRLRTKQQISQSPAVVCSSSKTGFCSALKRDVQVFFSFFKFETWNEMLHTGLIMWFMDKICSFGDDTAMISLCGTITSSVIYNCEGSAEAWCSQKNITATEM